MAFKRCLGIGWTRLSRTMEQINVHAAKTHLSQLLERAERGEQVVIARYGKPVAKIVPYAPKSKRESFYGCWRGQVDMSRFDEADEEIAREFGMLD